MGCLFIDHFEGFGAWAAEEVCCSQQHQRQRTTGLFECIDRKRGGIEENDLMKKNTQTIAFSFKSVLLNWVTACVVCVEVCGWLFLGGLQVVFVWSDNTAG